MLFRLVFGHSVFALGPPDSSTYGDTSASWTPNANSTAGSETLTLDYANPDYATGVLVRESSGNGFVTAVELQDTTSAWHSVWTGRDTTPRGRGARFPHHPGRHHKL